LFQQLNTKNPNLLIAASGLIADRESHVTSASIPPTGNEIESELRKTRIKEG